MKIVRGSEIEFVPASHEDPQNPGVLKRVLATKDDLFNGQVMMVNWARLPMGQSFQSHYHEDMLEVFIMLGGTVSMTVEGQAFDLNGGDAILVEPREIHRMTNTCDEDVDYVVFGISQEKGGKTVVVDESADAG
ncbi:MAG: cupin domain-containing protein [Planctomycetota bacterium]